MNDRDRFDSKISLVRRADECCLWKGYIDKQGYGKFRYQGRTINAHRAHWLMERGPIPKGMTVDHMCRNRACVNLAHLRLLTRAENVLAGNGYSGRNKRKQACPRGHTYDMIINRGSRSCRTCKQERERAIYHTIKDARNARRRKLYKLAKGG